MIFPLKMRVLIAPGADLTADPVTWTYTDITRYVRKRIQISRGQKDESGTPPPARCELRVNNKGGAFVTRNPLGPWYPLLKRNCPLLVQVDIGSGWQNRFGGFIDELPVKWSPGEQDTYVDIVASGITRRLGQGGELLRSAQYRAIVDSNPDGYWSLEDGPTSTQAASAVGGKPLALTAGTVRFGATPGPPGSASLADFSSGGTMTFTMPAAGTTSTWRLEFSALFKEFEPGSFGAALQWVTGGTIAVWEIDAAQDVDGGLSIQYITAAGGFGGPFVSNRKVDDGLWHHIRVDATQSGANIALTVKLDGTTVITQTLATQTMGAISGGIINPTGDVVEEIPSLGHLSVWAPFSGSVDTLAAFRGYAGEGAADRMVRVAAEEGVRIVVSSSGGEPMGPQPVASFMTILREAEDADCGILYERTDGQLGYLRRADRYNRNVDWALRYRDVSGPFEPTDDDRLIRNDITVTRSGGSSARYVDDDSVAAEGRYVDQATVNTQTDGVLGSHARWRGHLGTVNELRYPDLVLKLTGKSDSLIAAWLGCDIGSRITIADPPSELAVPLIDQIIAGYEETLDSTEWRVTLHPIPAAPWNVATVNGSQRMATRGNTLAADIGKNDLSLSLASTTGLWRTTASIPAAFPLDLRIGGTGAYGEAGGEIVTVSVISGGSSPQPVTLTARGLNGVRRAWPAGTSVQVAYPARLAL